MGAHGPRLGRLGSSSSSYHDAPRWRAPRPGLRSHVVHLERQQLVKGHFRIKERPTVLLGVRLLMDLAMAAARAIPANPEAQCETMN